MKLLSFLLLLVCSLSAQAQDAKYPGYARLPLEAGKVTYTAVVPVEGATKEELFTRAKEWVARTFVDSKQVARMEDKEAGIFVGHGIIHQPSLGFTSGANDFDFTISIYTKDGRYKYVIDQINMRATNTNSPVYGQSYPVESYAGYKKWKSVDKEIEDFDSRIKLVVSNLSAAMQGGTSASKDW